MANYAITITSKVTQAFSTKHSGEDHVAANGTNIASPVTGTVFRKGTGTMDGSTNIGYNYGNWIVLKDAAGYFHFFAHLYSNTVLSVGSSVSVGQVFAKAGQTGKVTGPHIHWSVYRILWNRSTLVSPTAYINQRIAEEAAAKPTPTQRQVKSVEALRRQEPSSKSAHLQPDLAAGEVGNFNGWITGESVSGNSVWFRGVSGDWFWSGGFTDLGTHDLANLNPVVINTKRTVGTAATNRRAAPNTSSPSISPSLQSGATIEVKGFAKSQKVSGIDIWFKNAEDDNWSWAGGFTSQDTSGLADLSDEIVIVEPIKITTFGIDVSSYQKTIDFTKAKAEGVAFVIVKQGGLNVSPAYTSVDYNNLVIGAKAAGLKVGHYWIVGAGMTPVAQAEFFVKNLYAFDVKNDVLALDNEKLDGNGTKWSDAQVASFFTRVMELTGIPASRLWHYANATDYRAGKWTETEKLGVKVWWAAYGSDPMTRVPDSEPVLNGVVKDWWVHQFSSKQPVAGLTVDGNWSKKTVAELFATGTVTPVQAPEKPDYTEIIAALTGLKESLTTLSTHTVEAVSKMNTAIINVIATLDDLDKE